MYKDKGYNCCAVIIDDETPEELYHFGAFCFKTSTQKAKENLQKRNVTTQARLKTRYYIDPYVISDQLFPTERETREITPNLLL